MTMMLAKSIPSAGILIPVFVFIAVFLFIAALSLSLRRYANRRSRIASRLSMLPGNAVATQQELIRIRRKRSLSSEGHYLLPFTPLNRLVLQSGSTLGLFSWLLIMVATGTAIFLGISALLQNARMALAAGLAGGVLFPLWVLSALREARQRKFEEQLPDAIDVLVRSLKAGHAVPTAISSVARNLPDPIGSEFSLTAAELTYGLDLETALVNLRTRVGQTDLALIVLAVSIQSKTGGNLAEILANLARVIRERFKLRRKAHALSAEGRLSAMMLSILPFVLFVTLWFIAPNYYGDVWRNVYVQPVLGGAVAWMLFGDWVMYRMVRTRV
jgi:tight adherence protein B